MYTLDIEPLRSESPPQKRSGMARVLKGFHSFTCMHTHAFIRSRNEPYLPLPCQPQLVLIYRPRRDGRLSGPWCEVYPGRDSNPQPSDCKSGTLPSSQPLAHLIRVYWVPSKIYQAAGTYSTGFHQPVDIQPEPCKLKLLLCMPYLEFQYF